MIDFTTQYDMNDLSPFCECAEYIAPTIVSEFIRRRSKIICNYHNYCCFLRENNFIHSIQTIINKQSIRVYSDYFYISSEYQDRCSIKPPICLKTFSKTIEKRLLLI